MVSFSVRTPTTVAIMSTMGNKNNNYNEKTTNDTHLLFRPSVQTF
jgi:hypothetical protein